MRSKGYFPEFIDEGEMMAGFGQAKLLKFLDGSYELRGGSREDRDAAHKWMSLFMQDKVQGKSPIRFVSGFTSGPI